MRHALIRDDQVVNIILCGPEFQPPEGLTLVALGEAGTAAIGWLYDGQSFAPPPDAAPEPQTPDLRPTKARFGDLFTDDEHAAMNLIRWQCRQMDAAERAIPGNPLVYAETLFIKFDLPAEFIELDLPMVAQGLGLLGMLGVFGDRAETRIPQVLANEDPPA
ncbi:hypothetical protein PAPPERLAPAPP_02530 [Brevundimonas phage vB_BpoS-Papperlapapp]|uniref:Uncharacterized protein n=1 Tax=Brevundimonas phage vB_BpoS-Domovoi TaxID=2948598 RepID=A0A9E7MQR9_9CAUD|nr:hypothetical protein DOMOVOI_01490 [Brevundimonas phage vB_BpoS-Domovoi]USN15994.1 hypothetical protein PAPPERLAPAPP_02530 [Brevundimonas phage vB_BpoS-Papperlapapp]